jgi:hypothetical protein
LPKLRHYRRLKEITIFAAVARWKMCESRNFGNMPDVRRQQESKNGNSLTVSNKA